MTLLVIAVVLTLATAILLVMLIAFARHLKLLATSLRAFVHDVTPAAGDITTSAAETQARLGHLSESMQDISARRGGARLRR